MADAKVLHHTGRVLDLDRVRQLLLSMTLLCRVVELEEQKNVSTFPRPCQRKMSHFQPRTQLFLAVPPTTCAAQSSSGPLPTWATRATAASLSIQILPRHLEWFNTQQETASGPKIDTIVSVVQTEILPVFRSPLPNDPKRPRPKMILTSALLSDRDEPEPHDMFLEYEIKDVKGRGRANGLEVIIEVREKVAA